MNTKNKKGNRSQVKSRNRKVRIIIERSTDSFSAYAENVPGVYGQGNSVDEAKQSALKSIVLLKKYNKIENVPVILRSDDYEVVFKFDTQSFLSFYKGIFTNAALERMTGINQKQLQHYASGLKKPRLTQVKRIETAMHSLGKELMSVEL